MKRYVWGGCAAAALGIAIATPTTWAENGLPTRADVVAPVDGEAGIYHVMDARIADPFAVHVAQATGSPSPSAGASGVKPDAPEVSASELNKQLANPVTSLWSLQFQFNNYRLENGEWSNNLLFQPVLPVGLTKDLNLITRPVIPLYNVVPHETSPGEFDHAVGFGDITLLELLSPAHSGNWILGVGPTFIFPTATSDFTGRGSGRPARPSWSATSRTSSSSASSPSSGGHLRATRAARTRAS